MYEEAQEVFRYLPIRRGVLEENYINHLWQTFIILDGGEAVVRSFGVMPFHLMFMVSVQYKVLIISTVHKQSLDLFFSGVGGRDKDKLLSEQRSVFDIALINERTMSEIFQLINLDLGVIKKFKNLVDKRNDNLAHAKGSIEQDFEEKIIEYLNILRSIQKCCLSLNQQLSEKWISEVQTDDNMDQFFETRFLDSYINQYDFVDVVKFLLQSKKLTIKQKKQIMQKVLEICDDETILTLKNL